MTDNEYFRHFSPNFTGCNVVATNQSPITFGLTSIKKYLDFRVMLYIFLVSGLLFVEHAGAAELKKAEPLSPALAAPIKVSMRTNGYTIGDLINMRAEIMLKKGQVFDPNSVPLKGPVNNWLDIREVKFQSSQNKDDSSKITLDFTWQIFGTVEMAQTIYIPAIALQTIPPEKGNTKPLTLTIPAQGFHLSPVLPPQVEERNHRPHALPLGFDTQTPLIMALTLLGLGLLFGGFWLWLQDKISWWPRNPGPLTKLARQLRTHREGSFNPNDLRTIHSGLAASAGQSLYPNTLPHLFVKCPYLATEKLAITQFFEDSWQVFHGKNAQTNAIDVSTTKAWIQRAAIAERLMRRQLRKPKGKAVQLSKKAHA